MPSPRRRPPEPPAQSVLLDWRAARHWSDRVAPCRYCGDLTHLRDEERRPAHKVCAERAAAKNVAAQVAAYSRTALPDEM
ncbi:hypothetical protein [Streptomyces sp. NRRL S-350]|uniref:hypothetical protein n=1 Tax=Streptomyces sp. NRRL S-350 TaxID=1463902 RepID=UPI0004BE7E25|nr:hypothetical protein [Streptomyces sp. NRRL S-350]